MIEINPFETSGGLLFESLLKGGAVLAIGLGVVALLRAFSSSLRHVLLMSALVAALCLPIFSSVLPAWNPEFSALPGSSLPGADDGVGVDRMETEDVSLVSAGSLGTPLLVAPDRTNSEFRLSAVLPMLTWLWLGGLLYFACRLGASFYLLRQLVRATRPAESESPTGRLLLRCQEALGMSRRVALRFSDAGHGPMTCGVWHPVIILPHSIHDWSEERTRAVLLHELAHIVRGDVASNIVARIACSVYWFVPFSWIAARWAMIERERACDDMVLNAGFDGRAYARHLVELARGDSRWMPSAATALGMAQGAGLERRVESLLGGKVNRKALSRTAALSLGVAIQLVLVPLAVLRAGDSGQSDAGGSDPTAAEGLGGGNDVVVFGELVGEEGDAESGFLGQAPKKQAREGALLEGLSSHSANGDPTAVESIFGVVNRDESEGMDASPNSVNTQILKMHSLEASEAVEMLSSMFSDKLRVVVHPKTNSLICSGSAADLRRAATFLAQLDDRQPGMLDRRAVKPMDIDEDGDSDLFFEDGIDAPDDPGIKVTISEIGGVRTSDEISIQATLVRNRVEAISLIVSRNCSYLKVAQTVEQLKEAGISEIKIQVSPEEPAKAEGSFF